MDGHDAIESGARDRELTVSTVAALSGGRLARGDPDRPVSGFSTDSRAIAAGDLFVALKGDRFDGHAFAAAAAAAGAAAVLASDQSCLPPDSAAAVVVVGDTLAGLHRLAREVRRRSGARVVAITGSAGKTTTKEIAASLIETRFRTVRSHGNLNNHVGLPLSLLQLVRRPEVAVVELGMNHAGEIRTLVGIAEPDIRVWINVAPVHAAHFASVEAIADAKAEILEGARPADVAVANADDALVMTRVERFPGRVVTFGIDTEAATVRAIGVALRGIDGSEATLVTPAGQARICVPLVGSGQLANVLAASAVALECGVPLEAIAPVVAALVPVAQRGRVERLAGGVTLVDDSYNSNPAALSQALAAVAAEARCGRRVAALGEMLELGDGAAAWHDAAGRAAAGSRLDWLVVIGGEAAQAMADGAVAAGLAPSRVVHVATSREAADLVAGVVRPGDLVLVKGSRGVATEQVAERVRRAFG